MTCERVIWFLLIAQAIAVAWLGLTFSVTCDECGHLGGGLYVWDYGKFDVYRVNPPLVRALACAPVALLGPNRDYQQYAEGPATRVEWRLGQDLIAANPKAWEWYFVFGRWAVLPLVLVGAYFVQRWATELYGDTCGLASLALWCFCPNVLAWGATFTPDAGAAALGVAAGYSFWKWLREPTWRRAIEAGVWLGLAELTKFSWIILFPLWPMLWVVWRVMGRREFLYESRASDGARDGQTVSSALDEKSPLDHRPSTVNPSFKQLAAILLLALYGINLGYAFEGTFTSLKDFVFVSRSLAGKDSKVDRGSGGNRFKESRLGQIPVPVPFNYLRGIDLQKVDFEEGKPSYLNGQWSERGWWYYYLYAATLKVPLGTWVIGLIVVLMKLSWRMDTPDRHPENIDENASGGEERTGRSAHPPVTWRDELVLLAPAVMLFVLVSSQTGFSRYFRYVLPCFPFVYVWLGQVGRLWPMLGQASGLPFPIWQARIPFRGLRWLAGGALAWSTMSSLSVFPHSMSYFNELAGGPRNGHRYLIDANIDWGQDMFHLRNWLQKHPEATPLYVAPLCFVPPRHYGIDAKTPPELPMPGWYAMSIHRIHGERGTYNFFLKYKPVALAGYSIYIYHVTLDDAQRVRRELGYPELTATVGPPGVPSKIVSQGPQEMSLFTKAGNP